MLLTIPYRLLLTAIVVVMTLHQSYGQELPVRSRQMRHLSNDGQHHVTLQATNGMVQNYVLTLPPDTNGSHRSMLTAVSDGAGNVAMQWLSPGANGTVLGIVNGAPAWTTAAAQQVQPVAILMNNMAVAVNAGTTVLRLTPDGPPVQRVITLGNGAVDGQQLVLRVLTPNAAFGVRLIDAAGNLELSGDADLQNNDTMVLLWDATTQQWLELSRRNN
jgi:hypothetical protein